MIDGAHLGYQTHYVVDGGKARIILARSRRTCRSHGEPAYARSYLPYLLSLETAASTGHG